MAAPKLTDTSESVSESMLSDLALTLTSGCTPRAVEACAVRPVFAGVVGELRAANPSNVQGPVKQNASPGDQSEAPRLIKVEAGAGAEPRTRKPGQSAHAGATQGFCASLKCKSFFLL